MGGLPFFQQKIVHDSRFKKTEAALRDRTGRKRLLQKLENDIGVMPPFIYQTRVI